MRAERVWEYLPGFLKRPGQVTASGRVTVNWAICQGIGAALDLLDGDLQLLRARGLAGQFSGEFTDYYSSAVRRNDVRRIAQGRATGAAPHETLGDLQTYLASWGDHAAGHGTKSGLQTELERSGLQVDSITEMRDDPERWLIRSYADSIGVPLADLSLCFAYADYAGRAPGQRTTIIYAWGEDWFGFRVLLSDPGMVGWDQDSVEQMVRRGKPAYTRGWVRLPGETYYVEVD